ncbi:MAG: hypothetical protein WA908_01510 [Pontixanthobacter sp.]
MTQATLAPTLFSALKSIFLPDNVPQMDVRRALNATEKAEMLAMGWVWHDLLHNDEQDTGEFIADFDALGLGKLRAFVRKTAPTLNEIGEITAILRGASASLILLKEGRENRAAIEESLSIFADELQLLGADR